MFLKPTHTIHDHIIYILVDYLFHVLGVSRSFQKALEARTFQKLLDEKGSMHGTKCRAHKHL